MKVVISSIQEAADGIRVFSLQGLDGMHLPTYEPGSHVDLTLGNGLTRQYSLCCDRPSSDAYRIAVKREPSSRGGSAWLHSDAVIGTVLDIGEPRNAFSLAAGTHQHLLFAGGIGITPILSMAYALLRRKQPFHVFYFVRDDNAVVFGDELHAGQMASHASVFTGLDGPQSAQAISRALTAGADGAHVYTCGPAPFMEAVTSAATPLFGAHHVHQEFFASAPTTGVDQSFALHLRKQGKTIEVPAGRTALSCLQEAGIEIDSSCEVGVCGTCRTAVIDGIPDHRDSYLSPQEREANRCFMPCVSRARSPGLTLDL